MRPRMLPIIVGAAGWRALAAPGLSLLLTVPLLAQTMNPRYYNPGTPTLTDIWVDPLNGNDGHSGANRSQALRSLEAAWNSIPNDATLTTTGYRIQLVAGIYTADLIPNYMERHYGTYACPVIIQAVDGQGTATLLHDLNIFDCHYLYLVDFNITAGANNLIHGEACTNLLMHGLTLQGDTNATQETIKMNQCQYIYLEDSDVSGAFWMAVDFFAVQHGHIVGNRLHNADWVAYLKGGSAYFRIEANEIYDGGTIGFTAGQGSGFEFMASPWLHYEASDIKFINNVVHDIDGAGMGVNGGYNILLAHNTLFRVGRRSHAIEVVFGERSCDGNTGRCAELLAAGGWGTVNAGVSEPIPNCHVYIYNNILYNPAGYRSADSHLAVYAPRTPSIGSNIPSPAETDTDLRFRGNIFWNGPPDLALGIGDSDQGGQPSNPTCNPAQFLADNTVNSLEPQLINPTGADFRPLIGGNVFSTATYAIPDFTGTDRPAPPAEPQGNLLNTVERDYYGYPRLSSSPPGAFAQANTNTTPNDYDGDGKSDLAVYRNGNWAIQTMAGNVIAYGWGEPGWIPVSGDYDGDGKSDLAVYRDGNWAIQTMTGSVIADSWGEPGWIPVSGDYDGDGKSDLAVYRDGNWAICTMVGSIIARDWGEPGWIPVPGDYDGG
ncbi:MAG: VCBS repeat-containing protein [Kiritimatiellaeota bacterium]|nr:VCBS repeat-containing protein [Kiritimatiellota bacterium]